MPRGIHMDERSVDCLVLCPNDQNRKVSAKSVTMRATTLCKNLSSYRESLLSLCMLGNFLCLSCCYTRSFPYTGYCRDRSSINETGRNLPVSRNVMELAGNQF